MSDLISRKDAIAEFSCCELTPDGGIDVNYAIDFLKQLPSAQPERTGKWLEIPHTFMWQCSLCSWINDISSGFNYCPDCGAKMEGD